jgi:hypothetical protein
MWWTRWTWYIRFRQLFECGRTYTNRDFYNFIHPWNDQLPYAYDDYAFHYCAEEGYDFLDKSDPQSWRKVCTVRTKELSEELNQKFNYMWIFYETVQSYDWYFYRNVLYFCKTRNSYLQRIRIKNSMIQNLTSSFVFSNECIAFSP